MSVTYLNKIKQGFTLRRQRVCVSTVSHKIIVTNCDRQTPSEATRTDVLVIFIFHNVIAWDNFPFRR